MLYKRGILDNSKQSTPMELNVVDVFVKATEILMKFTNEYSLLWILHQFIPNVISDNHLHHAKAWVEEHEQLSFSCTYPFTIVTMHGFLLALSQKKCLSMFTLYGPSKFFGSKII